MEQAPLFERLGGREGLHALMENIVANPQAFGLTLPALQNHPYFVSVGLDRDIDLLMTRTRRRPLPAHAIEPEDALVFGLALGVVAFCAEGAGAGAGMGPGGGATSKGDAPACSIRKVARPPSGVPVTPDQGKMTSMAFEKFAESPGIAIWSRYQHWKFQVSPGWTAWGGLKGRASIAIGSISSPLSGAMRSWSLKRAKVPARQRLPCPPPTPPMKRLRMGRNPLTHSMPRSTALTIMALTVLQDSRVSVHTACVVGQACSS